jgi:hypothetical protein
MHVVGYVDDSGTHEGAERTLAAAVFGRIEAWDGLEQRWRKMLQDYPAVRFLHSVSLAGKRRAFRGWSNERVSDLVERAARKIKQTEIFGVVSILYSLDYDLHYVADPKPRKMPLSSKFGVCVWACLDDALPLLRRFSTTRLDLVVEQGTASRVVPQLVGWLKKHGKPEHVAMLGDVKVGAKEEYPGLQVADLLAYPVYKAEQTAAPTMAADRADDAQTIADVRGRILRTVLTGARLTARKNGRSPIAPKAPCRKPTGVIGAKRPIAPYKESTSGNSQMALTRDFRDTVQARARRDAAFRKALLKEAVDCMLAGDVETGKSVLRDYINATVGFPELGAAMRKSPKSLMRMLGPGGNPQARNLFEIVAYLQESEGFRLTTQTTANVPDARATGFAEEAHRQSLAVARSRQAKADQDFVDLRPQRRRMKRGVL